MRAVLITVAILAGASTASAQALPTACSPDPLGIAVQHVSTGASITWCVPHPEDLGSVPAQATFRAYVDGQGTLLTGVACADSAGVLKCQGATSTAFQTGVQRPGLHLVGVTIATGPSTPESMPGPLMVMQADPAPAAVKTSCQYIPPGKTVMETRPVGTSLPGFNSANDATQRAEQAQRIADLRAWGWTVDLSYVNGSGRADGIDRVFLVAICQ